jgi:prepilin-type N-terminal cleavage/methylation domain-containing protein
MPTSGSTRRDPEAKGKGFSARGGFTIIEILIVLAILTIFITTMLPMNRTSAGQRALVDSANNLTEFLATARLESNIRQVETAVSYQYANGADWCLGFVTGQQACDCTQADPAAPSACVVDSELRVLRSTDMSSADMVKNMSGDGTFVFFPARGVAYDAVGRRIFDHAELQLQSDDQLLGMSVQVSSTGNISTCTHRGKELMPGYPECLNSLR